MTSAPYFDGPAIAPNAAPDIPVSLRELLMEQRRAQIAHVRALDDLEALLPASLRPSFIPYFQRARTTTFQQIRAIEKGLGLKKSKTKKAKPKPRIAR